MRHSNTSRAETRSIHLEGWSGTDGEGSLGRQQSRLKRVVMGCQHSEELSCHDTITRHLEARDSQKYSLKWQKELPLIQRSLKLFIPA